MRTKLNFCGYSAHQHHAHITSGDAVLSYYLRLQTGGSCVIIHNGKKTNVQKGTFLLIKPGDTYEILVNDPNNSGKIYSEDYHLSCEGTWIEDWAEDKINQQMFLVNDFENLVEIWKMLILESRQLSEKTDVALSVSLLQVICLLIERYACEQSQLKKFPYAVTQMMRYIEEYATTPLRAEDVARSADLSVSRSSFLFRNYVGKSMMDYALEVRLNIAVQKIKFTSDSLEKISEESGFSTYNYFHKVFRRKYNKSPRDYRKHEKDFYFLL